MTGFFEPGTKVSVFFEGTIVSEEGDKITIQSDSGFTQIVNLDYPAVHMTALTTEEEQ